MPKMIRLAACLLVCTLTLSSCVNSGVPLREAEVSLTFPPSTPQYAAPIGDAALEYAAESTLYLPMYDGSRLTSFTEEVVYSVARPQAESLVRALLNHPGNNVAAAIGGSVKLSLYGVNPVEVSRDVVTVNLAASALQLDRKAYYLACQAITNTLTMLSGIRYVNFLVMDKQLGLDIAGTLPAGAFSRSVGEDIGVIYEQTLFQRTSEGTGGTGKRLSSMVTLYFPIAGMDGLLPEARSISFESQNPASIALRLLNELSSGPQQISASSILPPFSGLLLQPPALIEAPEGGGKLIALHFSSTLDDILASLNLSRASCMASICYTLSTFLPGVTGIRVAIGDSVLSNVQLSGNAQEPAILFREGLQTRADYAMFVMDLCTLYFMDENEQKLVPVERAVRYFQTSNPRALLIELAKGPLPVDSVDGVKPLMPPGLIADSDLLGFSLQEDALLVNFAQTFSQIGLGYQGQQERLLAYGIVNTLSPLARIRRVCFFVTGNLPTGFSGEIDWSGDFYRNMGLVPSGE